MKEASKRLMCFVILLMVGILISIAYGIFIGGELSVYYYIFESVTLTAISLFFIKKSFNKNIVSEFVAAIITVGLVIFISFASYVAINNISGELIAEYDTEATTGYPDGVCFYDLQGNEQWVKKRFYYEVTPFIEKGKGPEEGDTVYIKEYNGLFDVTYYKLESWQNTNKNN